MKLNTALAHFSPHATPMQILLIAMAHRAASESESIQATYALTNDDLTDALNEYTYLGRALVNNDTIEGVAREYLDAEDVNMVGGGYDAATIIAVLNRYAQP